MSMNNTPLPKGKPLVSKLERERRIVTNLPDNPDVFRDENGQLEDIYGNPIKLSPLTRDLIKRQNDINSQILDTMTLDVPREDA